jgi:hypothetical protein
MRTATVVFVLLLAAASPVLAANQDPEPFVTGPDGSLDIYCVVNGTPDLGCCEANTVFIPGQSGHIQISVQARLSGATAGGISGAEFYVDGLENLPGNWTCTVDPAPDAFYVGDFCRPSDIDGDGAAERRGNLVFSVIGPNVEDGCQVGDNWLVPLATIQLADFATPEVDLPVLTAQIVAGDPPSTGPAFQCPLVTLCDAPVFTGVCVTGGIFIINNAIRAPINPSPPDGATGVSPLGLQLSWENPGFISCVLGTEIQNVHFGTEPNPPLVSTHHSGATYDPGPLQPLETYYWRVTRSFFGQFESSPIWSFTTDQTIGVERSTWANVKSLFR